ncbi:unnamed protein product [Psylliodes chrysocephalus]|uniref:Uncharacterized protein n=1 Tax=Psylliodes chrysocephalus TaxID=3402493 RepID=A0A9P0CPQ8_9CUCU|nr:unnamed protein product [Psylliodes chrysocephala]
METVSEVKVITEDFSYSMPNENDDNGTTKSNCSLQQSSCRGTETNALWEKLRHPLGDALRRQQKYFKSGAPAEAIKEWTFLKQMGFLQSYIANKLREGNCREDDGNKNVTQVSDEYVTFAEVNDENVAEVNIQQQDESIEDDAQLQKFSQTLPLRAAKTPTTNATPK